MYRAEMTVWQRLAPVLAGAAFAFTLAAGAPSFAQVDRVILALNTPNPETNRSWASSGSAHVQLEPFLESLLTNDSLTGAAAPGLAQRWEVSDDFREWRFFLRKGVPFHFGFSEFTAADVAHSLDLITQEESVSFLRGLWSTVELDVVNDYEVAFRFPDPMTEGEQFFSRQRGDFLIYSKAQFDAEGVEGIDNRPAGTGVYYYKERIPGEAVIYEHFADHWSGATPDFREMEYRWAPENATRLAMLLAGEAHIADISRDLQGQAEAEGMKVIAARQTNQQTLVFIGGVFHRAEDAEQDPAWLGDVKVRQALNMAINRQEVIDFIYGGRGSMVYNLGFHPDNEGWNPEWQARFEEMYGYNPERARQLIAESPYDAGEIQPTIFSFSLSGSSEIPLIAEALQLYFQDIGVNAKIEETDWASVRPRLRGMESAGFLTPLRNTPIRTTQQFVSAFYRTGGPIPIVLYDETDRLIEAYGASVDPDVRNRLAREIGDFLYERFVAFPMAEISFELMVDPKVVADWIFPGASPSVLTHHALIKAAR